MTTHKKASKRITTSLEAQSKTHTFYVRYFTVKIWEFLLRKSMSKCSGFTPLLCSGFTPLVLRRFSENIVLTMGCPAFWLVFSHAVLSNIYTGTINDNTAYL